MPYSYYGYRKYLVKTWPNMRYIIFIPRTSLKIVQHLQQRLNLLRYIAYTVAHPVQQHLQSATIRNTRRRNFNMRRRIEKISRRFKTLGCGRYTRALQMICHHIWLIVKWISPCCTGGSIVENIYGFCVNLGATSHGYSERKSLPRVILTTKGRKNLNA